MKMKSNVLSGPLNANWNKYDENGHSQIFNARWETDRWKIYQTSDWEWRWQFGGGGAS